MEEGPSPDAGIIELMSFRHLGSLPQNSLRFLGA